MASDTTLLLAAHGSSRPDENNPVRLLADRLKAQGPFKTVRCGFLKEPPFLTDVLFDIQTPYLSVVPVLTSRGFITDELIPKTLEAAPHSTRVRLFPPLGTHQGIPEIMAERALQVIEDHQLERSLTSVLIAAHGNTKNPENARQTKMLASQIEAFLGPIHVHAAFIEETPLISDWHRVIDSENLIILPFLIGGGLHGAEDVPAMLGLDPEDTALDRLCDDMPSIGPLIAMDRKLWYCRALGYEPNLIKIIGDLVK